MELNAEMLDRLRKVVLYRGEADSGRKCSFCGATTHNPARDKTGWVVCHRPSCQAACLAQEERVYAGLVDCQETRSAALNWVQSGGLLQ